MPEERVRLVHFRPRTVLVVIGILVAVFAILQVLWIARHILAWIFIALFLALALNPAVDQVERRLKRRGLATGIVYMAALAVIVAIGALFIPTLFNQVDNFAHKVPEYLDDLTKGRGRLGFLQEKYHLVDKARDAVREGGAAKLFGLSGTAVAVAKGVVTVVVATLTIAFLTFFMLLEGPRWVDRFYSLLNPASRSRWQTVGGDIYRTVGGYVTGNLLISLIAGTLTTIVLAITRVPYAIALGLIVAILDLIPLAGATIAAILVGTVAFLHSITAGIVVVIFFVVYQQIENHLLQPVVYGRTVQLSPLAVLISVLIGAELAGVLGAPPARGGPCRRGLRSRVAHHPFGVRPHSGPRPRGRSDPYGIPRRSINRSRSLGHRAVGRSVHSRRDRRPTGNCSACARAGRALQHERAAPRARARSAPPLLGAGRRGASALVRDGDSRLLQPQLGERLLLWPPGRPLLSDGAPALLVRRREPALVVA